MNTKSEIKKLDDGTIDLLITVPWDQVKKTKEDVINEHVKDASIAGFRKGKAPKKLVEEKLDKEHIKEDVLKKLLPIAYSEAVKEHNLTPIISPRIHVEKLEDNADWTLHAQTCEMPKLTLNNYKDEVKKLTAKEKIIIPGKEKTSISFNDIAKVLLENSQIVVPNIIIEQEVEKLLAQTLDEIKRLGLTLDQYLASSGKTIEGLKTEYAKKAETDVRLEFILQQIAQTEKITVEDKEIDDAVATAKTPEEKQNLEKNKYLLASIIRQQKTLDFLRNL